ncbi:MAG: 30S ribosomal protein S6 [Bacteroidota bacterium]|nr:30S ribosomal protein S6 [Bacteroidota bacterium]MDP4231293.1 30S ribosomal protein S6 [Bacteroidota bacterium]MDP4235470.1 30S ribosomal protein S6 [Bacteroidota bacterium]
MAEKRYESTFLLSSNLQDEPVAAIIKKFEDIITKNGGKLIDTERWGVRRLAYEIKKHTSAHYISLHYTAPSTTNAKLDRAYQLDEDILRWLTLEMPDENHQARIAMKTRAETVEARKISMAQAKSELPA